MGWNAMITSTSIPWGLDPAGVYWVRGPWCGWKQGRGAPLWIYRLGDGLSLLDRCVVFGYVGGCRCFKEWCFDALGDRGRLWLKFLSFRGLCCQVAVMPHAQWGAMRQGYYWGSGVGFGTKWSPVSAGMVTEAWDWWGGDERRRCQGTDTHSEWDQ